MNKIIATYYYYNFIHKLAIYFSKNKNKRNSRKNDEIKI